MARGLAFWRWWVGVLALEGSSVGGSAFYRAQARVRALAVLKFIALERLVLAWVGLRSSARGALSCEGSCEVHMLCECDHKAVFAVMSM